MKKLKALRNSIILVIVAFLAFCIFCGVFLGIFIGGVEYLLASGSRIAEVSQKVFGFTLQYDLYEKRQHGRYSDIEVTHLSLSKFYNSQRVKVLSAEKLSISLDVWDSLIHFRPVFDHFYVNNAEVDSKAVSSPDLVSPFASAGNVGGGSGLPALFFYLKLQRDIQVSHLRWGDFQEVNFHWGSVEALGLPTPHYEWSLDAHLINEQADIKTLGAISGNFDKFQTLSSNSYLQISGKNFSSFSSKTRDYSGKYSGEGKFWIEVEGGQVHSVKSLISITPTQNRDLVKNFDANIAWQQNENGWSLQVQPLSFSLENNVPVQDDFLEASETREGGLSFFSRSIDLSVLSYIFSLFPPAFLPNSLKPFNALIPAGKISDLTFTGVLQAGKLSDYKLNAAFSNLSVKASGKFPSFSRLSGLIRSNSEGGTLNLRGDNFSLNFPQFFSAPWEPMTFSSLWKWQFLSRNLLIQLPSFLAKSAHLELSAKGSLQVPQMDWSLAKMQLLVGTQGTGLTPEIINSYLPEKLIHPNLYQWLTHSIVVVPEVQNSFLFSGLLQQAPFLKAQGVLEDSASIYQGSLIPWPSWPAFDQVMGNLFFYGSYFSSDVTSARTLQNEVGPVHIEVPDSSPGKPSELKIEGQANHLLGEHLTSYVTFTPLLDQLPFVKTLQILGVVGLKLHLLFPLGSSPLKKEVQRSSEIKGSLFFSQNKLRFKTFPIWMNNVSGEINFNGLELNTVHPVAGELLGEPWEMDLSPDQVRISGDFDFSRLAKKIKNPVFERISGKAPVIIAIDMRRALSIEIRSYLKLVKLDLPPPLFKPAGQRFPFRLTLNQLIPHEGLANSAGLVDSLYQGDFSLGSLLKGAYQLGPDLLNLHVTFGSDALGRSMVEQDNLANLEHPLLPGLENLTLESLTVSPFKQRILVDGEIAELDLGAWLDLLSGALHVDSDRVSKEKNQSMQAIQNIQNIQNIQAIQSNVDIFVNFLKFFSQKYTETQVGLYTEHQQPLITFKGNQLEGEVIWDAPIQAKFKTLYLQNNPSEISVSDGAQFPLIPLAPSKPNFLSPEELTKIPPLWLEVEHLYWNKREIGGLSLGAFPVSEGIEVQNGQFNLPSAEIGFSGRYFSLNKGSILKASIEARATDFGQALSQLGMAGTLDKARGALFFKGQWEGGALTPNLSTLSGVLGVSLFDGTFLNINSPGISRLLGLFSIESLAKHLSLNFKDMQQKGFMFGEISGAYLIKNGVASTPNLLINGPNLRVNLSGEIDLVNKTMDQTVVALPNIDGGVALAAGLIGGPLLGVMAWVADKVLTNTILIDKGIVYHLKGPWGKETV